MRRERNQRLNTPTHVAASLLVWRKESDWKSVVAVACGAFLPDAPMFGFYGYQRLWAGASEREIWTTSYFDPSWQLFFDLFNSIPIAVVMVLLCRRLGLRFGQLVSASALLHMCCDLPVHHDDAHRHFLPLSDWRFESPISYWDPQHHGVIFAIVEMIFAITACGMVGWKTTATSMRAAAFCTLGFYGLGIAFAFVFWIT